MQRLDPLCVILRFPASLRVYSEQLAYSASERIAETSRFVRETPSLRQRNAGHDCGILGYSVIIGADEDEPREKGTRELLAWPAMVAQVELFPGK